MRCLSPYSLQIHFFRVTVLLVIYFCDQFVTSKIRHSMSLQCLSTISDEDKILIRSLYLKRYTAKRLTDEFPEKRWTNFLQIFSKYGSKCRQIAFLIASNFVSHSPYWLQIKFFSSLLFYLFTLRSICGTGNSSQQTSLPYLSTVNIIFSDEDLTSTPHCNNGSVP